MISARPWGNYEVSESHQDFQIKLIAVNPGQRLSLQSHKFRAENWIIVSGIAQVSCDGKISNLHPQDSIQIPIGSKHRVTNPGNSVLQFVEVQLGTSFAEDDIVRYEDDYGRVD